MAYRKRGRITDDEMRRMYESGATLASVAETAGLTVTTVRVRLAAAGTGIRRGGTLPGAQKAGVPGGELARRFLDGEGPAALALAYGVNIGTVYRYLVPALAGMLESAAATPSRAALPPLLALRRTWLARIDGLYAEAAGSEGGRQALLLARAGEIEQCETELRKLLREGTASDGASG